MLEAYVIYTFLLVLFVLCSLIRPRGNRNLPIYMAILLAAFILGLRYDVGTDFMAYKDFYVHQNFNEVEWGYALLNIFFYKLGFSYSSVFVTVVFLQLTFFFKGFEKYPKLLPYAFFFYFTTLYLFFSLNVIRQALAFSMFVYSIHFIEQKKFIKYALVLFIAGSFHSSALFLIPFYFFIDKNIFINRKVQFILYAVSFIFGKVILNYIWDNFGLLSVLTGDSSYSKRVEILKAVKWAEEGGLGYLFWLVVDTFVIYIFYWVSKKIKEPFFHIVYNFYFIGILVANLVQGTYLARINVYFVNMRILIYSLVFLFILTNTKAKYKKILCIGFLLVLILFFYLGIANKASKCAPFHFVNESLFLM